MKNGNVMNQQTNAHSHNLDKELHEFETRIKYMNYKLFLEHTHSDEYYIQRRFYSKQEGEDVS